MLLSTTATTQWFYLDFVMWHLWKDSQNCQNIVASVKKKYSESFSRKPSWMRQEKSMCLTLYVLLHPHRSAGKIFSRGFYSWSAVEIYPTHIHDCLAARAQSVCVLVCARVCACVCARLPPISLIKVFGHNLLITEDSHIQLADLFSYKMIEQNNKYQASLKWACGIFKV